jgi:hypothetical protein
MCVVWTKGIEQIYNTIVQLRSMMAKSKTLKYAINFAQLNVKGTKPTTAMESAFLSADHAMEIV